MVPSREETIQPLQTPELEQRQLWATRPRGFAVRETQIYNSLRPSIAFCMVTSSAYSMSLPTGMPVAMRVTRTPAGLSRRDR